MLFGGCVILAGIANTAIADLSYRGHVSGNYWNPDTYQYNGYTYFSSVSEVSWTSYYSNSLTGTQDGLYGIGSSDNAHGWWLSMTIHTDDAGVFTFSTERITTGETQNMKSF